MATWNTGGNAGTNPPTDFLGTTDANALVLKMNSIQGAQLTRYGLAIGFDGNGAAATFPTTPVGDNTAPSTSGFTLINDGYVGINTSFYLDKSAGGAGSVAACSPLAVTSGGNLTAAQFWNESTSGTVVTAALANATSPGPTNNVAFLGVAGNATNNYVFVGNDNNGITYSYIDNHGAMGLGVSMANKGTGTINVSGGIYKNGTAYTNPDYVFEHHRTGRIVTFANKQGASEYPGLRPLKSVEEFVKENDTLPLMSLHRDGDLFERGDLMLASLEEAYLYLFQHEEVLRRLEHRLAAIEAGAASSRLEAVLN